AHLDRQQPPGRPGSLQRAGRVGDDLQQAADGPRSQSAVSGDAAEVQIAEPLSRFSTTSRSPSGDPALDDLASDVREPEVATHEPMGQLEVVHAEEVQDRGVQVVDV